MLLAKLTPYPDLLMASKILNLPNLPARIKTSLGNRLYPRVDDGKLQSASCLRWG